MHGAHALALAPSPVRSARPSVRRASRRSAWGVAGTGLVVPLALLVFWQVSSLEGWMPEQILPAPAAVFGVLRDGWQDGSLAQNLLASLRRVAEGFGTGVALGLVVGTATGLSGTLRRMIEPSFLVLGQIPVFGWMPVLVLLVGIGSLPQVIVIAWSALVPVVLNTARAIRDVPAPLLELGRSLGFDRWSKLTLIVAPAIVPMVFTGMREALANAWQTLVAVELLGSFDGLGYMMAYGRELFQLEMVLAAALLAGIVGLALHLALSAVERRLQRWRVEAA